jgi:hypothetical protein
VRHRNQTFFEIVFLILISAIGIKIFGEPLFFILAGCLVVGMGILKYKSTPICPSCHARGDFVYRHSRVDGGPDMRYHSNPLICRKCGASSYSQHRREAEAKVVSCHYVSLPGHRVFKDCPNYPKISGEKCKLCWIKSEAASAIESTP